MNCFRPLAGIMVLIGLCCLANYIEHMWFPSPCGDYGSYRSLGYPHLLRRQA